MPLIPKAQEMRMPTAAIGVVVAVSILPFLLILLGVNLATPASLESATSGYVHTLLEWSAVCVAAVTVLLALLHYREKGESTTPIIGLAWFCAGLIDLFHTLGADRLIPVAADPAVFTEFTWVISRIANASILIAGAIIFLISGQTLSREQRKRGMGFVLAITAICGLIVAAGLYLCATRPTLPDVLRSWAFVGRTWDLVPLLLFGLAGSFVFPTFYRWHSSVFTHALLVSMIPHVAAQLHMAFGSAAVFDGHYHAAHFLKVIAYAVPLVGLLMDYRQTHALGMQAEEERAGEYFVRQQAEEALSRDRAILRILMEHGADMVSIKDASLNFTRVNKNMAAFLGLASPIDAVGKNDADFYVARYVEEIRRQDAQVLAHGKPITGLVMEAVRKQQEVIQERAPDIQASVYIEKKIEKAAAPVRLAVSKFPLKNEDGRTLGIVTLCRPL
jgi:PAS domain-containing protein